MTHAGELIFAGAYGVADLEDGTPITPKTVFETMSVSKQFTAMAVALLIADGKVRLDDDIRRYLPEFPEVDPAITVADLIHHTSGLRSWDIVAALGGKRPTDRISSAEIVTLLARQRGVQSPAGTTSSYDNTNYILLGVIVERVTGQSLREFTTRRIFGPLGMRDTHFEDNATEVVPRRAIGYIPAASSYEKSMLLYDHVGPYALLTTVEDLARWEGNFLTGQVGGAQTVALMQMPIPFRDGRPANYAFGLARVEYRGRRFVQHTGSGAGFRSTFMRFPAESIAVAVLCNVSTANSFGYALDVADVVVPLAPGGATGATAASVAAPPPAKALTPQELARFVGTYFSADAQQVRRVFVRGDSLLMLNGPSPFQLIPIAANEVVVRPDPSVHYVFGHDSTGRWMRRETTGAPTQHYVWLPNRKPSARELRGLEGTYASEELGTFWNVVASADTLVIARLHGASESARMASSDVFTVGPTVIQFSRDARGVATGFTYSTLGLMRLRFARCGDGRPSCERVLFTGASPSRR